jgi:hypothetical protein
MTAKRKKTASQPSVESRATRPNLEGVLDAMIEVSRKQAQTLSEMRTALEEGDDEKSLEKARELTGLPRKARR